jgi:isopenicillin-N epimerase
MISRRAFFRRASAGTGAVAALTADWGAVVRGADAGAAGRPAEAVAGDEDFWHEIQQAFTLDRTMINLNNGGVSPSPRVVHEAYKRYLDISNQAPSYYMWQVVEPAIEAVRRQLAGEFGCDPEELAITRNASEALQAAQLGIDLKPGDEVVTTNQDYPRMLDTWEQRVRRDGISLKKISFPVPPTTQKDLADRLLAALSARTKVLHFCHITNLTGQIFPVQNLARMARARGIITIVDGAHAAAHFPFKLRDLEMDYYGTSLHKWLLAPTGTGFLYVRRDRIAKTWPMQAAPERSDNDIRKFEEIGTSPAATKAAINEALAFHQAIGTDRVAARLRYLTLRWANKLKANPRVIIHTGLDQVYGVACVGIKDIPASRINSFMWDKYRIITTAINRPEYNGIRVTPNIYTPLEEIDTFIAAMEDLLKNGLPATA